MTVGNTMQNSWREIYQHDEYRYFGSNGPSKLQRWFRPSLRYSRMLRRAQSASQQGNRIQLIIAKIFLSRMTTKWHFQIPPETRIGPGLYLGHIGAIVVNPDATLGRNVNLAHGVTIGQANRGHLKGAPTIGDHVWIGTGSTIVGKITIGNDVLIAPNTYVNFDVPAHSIVVGNPGKITSRENATSGYINNTL